MTAALWAFVRSFWYALQGVWVLVATQRNARVHVLAIGVVIFTGLVLHISRAEWLAVTLICTLVLALEGVNTAVEALVDLVAPDLHPLAKRAKDVAAGAVLIAAAGALVIAALIVFPRL